MSGAFVLALALIGMDDKPAATHPFASPKYGVKVDLPAAWSIAEAERDERVFVALIDGLDKDRPGAAVCEIGLAPSSLDEYRTRIDANAKRGGRRGESLVSNKILKDKAGERLETLREFRPAGGGVWSELTVRLVAHRQLYTFILNVDEKTYPTARPAFDRMVAGAKLTPPNTGADRLEGNRWLQREFKFSLDLPPEWEPVLAPSEVALFYANTKSTGVWADNLLVLGHEHRRMNLQVLSALLPEELKAAEPNCEVLACKVVKQNGRDALETIVRTKRGPFSMTVLERRFKGDRFDYEVKFTVESVRFEALEPAMRKTLDSFREAPGVVPRPEKGKDA